MSLSTLWDKDTFPPYDGVGFNPVRPFLSDTFSPSYISTRTQEHFVSINDVARAHVDAALNPSISNGHRYILCADRKTWAQVARFMVEHQPVLAKHLPPLPAQPDENEEPRTKFPVEADKIEKDFGWKCASSLHS